MIVRVLVPRALAEFASGQSELAVAVEGVTVRDVVDAICAAYPALGRRIAAALDRSIVVLPLPLMLALPTAAVVASCWNMLGQASIVSPDKLREATVPSWAASAARARHDLGFEPAATLDARLRETADGLRADGLV